MSARASTYYTTLRKVARRAALARHVLGKAIGIEFDEFQSIHVGAIDRTGDAIALQLSRRERLIETAQHLLGDVTRQGVVVQVERLDLGQGDGAAAAAEFGGDGPGQFVAIESESLQIRQRGQFGRNGTRQVILKQVERFKAGQIRERCRDSAIQRVLVEVQDCQERQRTQLNGDCSLQVVLVQVQLAHQWRAENGGRDLARELVTVQVQELEDTHVLGHYFSRDLAAKVVVTQTQIDQSCQVTDRGGNCASQGVVVHVKNAQVGELANCRWNRTRQKVSVKAESLEIGHSRRDPKACSR